jgi:hypothetical protein
MPDSAPPTHSSHPLTELQREVQRKLGACLIQVQQYELLMKLMLGNAASEGTMSTIETARAKAAANFYGKSLGVLIKDHLLKDLIVNVTANSGEGDKASDSELQAIAQGLPHLKFRYQISLEPEQLESTSRAIEAMRDVRNDLVHHFIDRFSLKSEEGCARAMAHLDACQSTFEISFAQLKNWAEEMINTRERLGAFIQTQMVEDILSNGIHPDGTVDWPASGVVRALREAESACAKEGWTLLDSAIAWLRTDHPDQTPTIYRCRTWRQVLKRSNQFEVRADAHPVSQQGQTWFRSRTSA